MIAECGPSASATFHKRQLWTEQSDFSLYFHFNQSFYYQLDITIVFQEHFLYNIFGDNDNDLILIPLLGIAESDSKTEIEEHWKWLEDNLITVLGKMVYKTHLH